MRAGRRHLPKKRWATNYRDRMLQGWEPCRNVGCDRLATTFGHLVPHVRGGRYTAANVTLLCPECNHMQGSMEYPWLVPILDEPDFFEIVYGHEPACSVESVEYFSVEQFERIRRQVAAVRRKTR